jgi:hypothetical protein
VPRKQRSKSVPVPRLDRDGKYLYFSLGRSFFLYDIAAAVGARRSLRGAWQNGSPATRCPSRALTRCRIDPRTHRTSIHRRRREAERLVAMQAHASSA